MYYICRSCAYHMNILVPQARLNPTHISQIGNMSQGGGGACPEATMVKVRVSVRVGRRHGLG